MIQTKTSIIASAALIVGLAGGFVLRPIIDPSRQQVDAAGPATPAVAISAPRATQFFAAHLDEARQVVSRCQSGALRSIECENAGNAVAEADGKDRFRKFMGH